MPASRHRPPLTTVFRYLRANNRLHLAKMLNSYLLSTLDQREAIDWINLYIDLYSNFIGDAAASAIVSTNLTLPDFLRSNCMSSRPTCIMDNTREVFCTRNILLFRIMTFSSFSNHYLSRLQIFSDSDDANLAQTIRKYPHLVDSIPGIWCGRVKDMVWAGSYAEIKKRTRDFSDVGSADFVANILGIPDYVGPLLYFVYSSKENGIRTFKPTTIDAGSEINPCFVSFKKGSWGRTSPMKPSAADDGCKEVVHESCSDLKLRKWGFVNGACSSTPLNLDVHLDRSVNRAF